MKFLLIKKCDDEKMWYNDYIGKYVPYLGQWPDSYKSIEPGGYVNIVKFEDAQIVEIKDSE